MSFGSIPTSTSRHPIADGGGPLSIKPAGGRRVWLAKRAPQPERKPYPALDHHVVSRAAQLDRVEPRNPRRIADRGRRVAAGSPAAGGTLTAPAHMRPFGVYSGYFADPDGHPSRSPGTPTTQQQRRQLDGPPAAGHIACPHISRTIAPHFSLLGARIVGVVPTSGQRRLFRRRCYPDLRLDRLRGKGIPPGRVGIITAGRGRRVKGRVVGSGPALCRAG
jgi:hypothetical protein